MKTSIPRLRSVTFKDGRARITIIHNNASGPCPILLMAHKHSKALTGDLAGFAIVSWRSDGSYIAKIHCPTVVPVAYVQVPDYVRAVLTRDIIEHDTFDAINEANGYYEEPDDAS